MSHCPAEPAIRCPRLEATAAKAVFAPRFIRHGSSRYGTGRQGIRQASGYLTGASPDIRQPSPRSGTASPDIRQTSPRFGIASPDIQRPSSRSGTKLPSIPQPCSQSGIASRKARQPNSRSGIAVLRLFIHLRHVGTAPGQPKEASCACSLAPLKLLHTTPPVGTEPHPIPEASRISLTRAVSSPLPAGEGKGEGERLPCLSGISTAQTPLPLSLIPALSRWAREERRLLLSIGEALPSAVQADRVCPSVPLNFPDAHPACGGQTRLIHFS